MSARRLGGVLAALALAVAACGGSASTSQPQPGSSAAGSVAIPLPSFAAAGGGSCSVKISGGMTASWSTPQNMGTLLIGYWINDADKKMLTLSATDAYLLMNCQSDTGSISLSSTTGTTTDQFPEKPGTYVIEAGGLGGDSTPGQVKALTVFKDGNLWEVTQPGTLTVTTFDGGHFAGTFNLQIGERSDDLSTIVTTATIDGTFNLSCTGSVCH
jgi:hypothetical protein